MKVKLLIANTGLFCLLLVTAAAQNDIEAIKAVIERETTFFFSVDRPGWEVNWLNAPYTYWSFSDSVGGSFVEGTDNIKKNFDEYFKTAKPSKSKIERTWLVVRVYDKGAYVRFLQKVTDDIDNDETSEVRMLEKDKDGKWKIIFLNAFAKHK